MTYSRYAIAILMCLISQAFLAWMAWFCFSNMVITTDPELELQLWLRGIFCIVIIGIFFGLMKKFISVFARCKIRATFPGQDVKTVWPKFRKEWEKEDKLHKLWHWKIYIQGNTITYQGGKYLQACERFTDLCQQLNGVIEK